jgi:hypothetical protein
LAGVPRLLLSRIGYWIYYRESKGVIDVLALWHVSRGSRPQVP